MRQRLYYVEVQETRRFTGTVEVRNEKDARERAADLHSEGKLSAEELETEIIAVRADRAPGITRQPGESR